MELDRETTNRTPRWVKVFGIIAIVVAVLFVIMLIAGGGRHGPSRHRPSEDNPGGQTLSTEVAEVGRVSREAGH